MKKLVAVITLLGLAALPFLVVPEQASAGSSTDAALALGAFAVLNQIVSGETIFNRTPHVVRETVVEQQPSVVYAPPPPPAVIYTPPAVVYGPPPMIYAPAPPPAVYYVPAPAPVYAYPYGYPHYRAAYRW